MSKTNIHPTAIIEPGAKIGDDVTVEAYAVIKSTVILENRAVIKSHAYIDGNTTIGEGTTVYPSASIGTKTQDLKFAGEKTYVKIGKNCDIREYVTINSSCQEGSVVSIGDNCLIMANCHIAHNCTLGNRVIMGNNAALAGHIIVEDCAIISGLTGVHQFVRIGGYAMIGGMSRITHDIPPYTIGAGIPFKFGGLNIIGLKRHGFPLRVRRALSKAFKLLYRSNLGLNEALARMEVEADAILPEVQHWIKFCRESKRGLMCLQGIFQDDELEFLEEAEEMASDEDRLFRHP
jgi:UDP-N-acetylglucosamine acyltransferase